MKKIMERMAMMMKQVQPFGEEPNMPPPPPPPDNSAKQSKPVPRFGGKVVIENYQKNSINAQIQQMVQLDRTVPISKEIKKACEIVHYAIENDIPVETKYLYLIMPQIDLRKSDDSREQYNQWLKYRHNQEHPVESISQQVQEDVKMSKQGQGGDFSQEQLAMLNKVSSQYSSQIGSNQDNQKKQKK